jgi:hypothetical protein
MLLLEGYTYIFQILRALVRYYFLYEEFGDFSQPISRWTNYTTEYIDIEVHNLLQGAHQVKFFRILLALLILLHHLPQ